MLRPRFLVLFPVVVLLACDRPPTTAPADPTQAVPPAASALLSYRGVIESGAPLDPDGLYLNVTEGPRIRLVGGETARLARVVGAEVSLRGTLDAVDAMIVQTFLVIAVGGLPAADGVLVQVGEDYGIRLLIDGSMRTLVNPPDELKVHVGERVWITGPSDAPPVGYGVIGGAT